MKQAVSNTPAADPFARYSTVKANIKIDALRACSMHELWLLREAVHTVADIICSQMWSPTFKEGAAQDVLESLNGFMCFYEEAITRVARDTRPSTKNDAQWRSWLILGAEASCAEDLARFAVMAAEAVRDEADAEFDERHQKCA